MMDGDRSLTTFFGGDQRRPVKMQLRVLLHPPSPPAPHGLVASH